MSRIDFRSNICRPEVPTRLPQGRHTHKTGSCHIRQRDVEQDGGVGQVTTAVAGTLNRVLLPSVRAQGERHRRQQGSSTDGCQSRTQVQTDQAGPSVQDENDQTGPSVQYESDQINHILWTAPRKCLARLRDVIKGCDFCSRIRVCLAQCRDLLADSQKVHYLVGLTLHCLILSVWVLSLAFFRFLVSVVRFLCYFGCHLAVYNGDITPIQENSYEPVTTAQLKEATVFDSPGLKLVLIQSDRPLTYPCNRAVTSTYTPCTQTVTSTPRPKVTGSTYSSQNFCSTSSLTT